jgi:hypothetical protein
MSFFRRFVTVLKRAGLPLLVISIFSSFLEQILTQVMEREMTSMSGASPLVWVYGGASILLSVLNPILISLFVIAALKPVPVGHSLLQHGAQVTKEILRSAGKSISWGLLLIVPGVVRFIQFSFVCFVVLLDPEYELGKRDALKQSTQLVNRSFFQVLGVLILFSIVFPVLLTSFDEYTLFLVHPMAALGFCCLDVVLSTACLLLLLKIYFAKNQSNQKLVAA